MTTWTLQQLQQLGWIGPRVRQCDHCRVFFLAKRNHRRKHHFCCDAHRHAFDQAHRDPAAQAKYMRAYRKRVREGRYDQF